ncbi:MAG: hypothetical protein NTZ63_02810 [Candidatus Omnitrophica bacterium]|nr:hypothetical protein [Candidatus Omnitrophota bacterium]
MSHKPNKIISILLCFLLIFEQSAFAQPLVNLNISKYLGLRQGPLLPDRFRPLHLRYLSYDIKKSNFQLLLDRGDTQAPAKKEIEDSTKTLLKYFFIGLTLPNDVFWVNLRPDSPDDIIDSRLAKTDIGRIFLEADLQLKKDTANFTNPNTPVGKEYWDKLYKKAGELFGSENVTIPTLTRPWIVADEIIIREAEANAYIYKATLKVMLEQDYLKNSATYNFDDPRLKKLNEYSSQLIRELVIPNLNKEINNSKRYAALRQVYYSLILAQWFKDRQRNQSGPYSKLIDSGRLSGLVLTEKYSKDSYFKAYQESFKNGEYNVKEPRQGLYGQVVRSYFSGGMNLENLNRTQGQTLANSPIVIAALVNSGRNISANVEMAGDFQVREVSTQSVQATPVVQAALPLQNTVTARENVSPSVNTPKPGRIGTNSEPGDNGAIGKGSALQLRQAIRTSSVPNKDIVLRKINELKEKIASATLGVEEKKNADLVIAKLTELYQKNAIEVFDAIVKGQEDYLLAFAGSNKLALMSDMFSPQFSDYLDELLFHEGYVAVFGEGSYDAHRAIVYGIQRKIFGQENPLRDILRRYINQHSPKVKEESKNALTTLRDAYPAEYPQIYSLIIKAIGEENINKISEVNLNGSSIQIKLNNGEVKVVPQDVSKLILNEYERSNCLLSQRDNSAVILLENKTTALSSTSLVGYLSNFYKITWGNPQANGSVIIGQDQLVGLLTDMKTVKMFGKFTNRINAILAKLEKPNRYKLGSEVRKEIDLLSEEIKDIAPVLSARLQFTSTMNEDESKGLQPLFLVRSISRADILSALGIRSRPELLGFLNHSGLMSDLMRAYGESEVGNIFVVTSGNLLDFLNRLKESDFINLLAIDYYHQKDNYIEAETSGNPLREPSVILPFGQKEPVVFLEYLSPLNRTLFSREVNHIKGFNQRGILAQKGFVTQVVGFFPGLGSASDYRDLGSKLYDTGIPEVQRIYNEAARALGYIKNGKPDSSRLFFKAENMPQDKTAKMGFISAAFLVHNLALHAYLKHLARENSNPINFTAYTGESLGILTAAVASGSLSVADGVKIAQYFIPRIIETANEVVDQEHHVIGISADNINQILRELTQEFGADFEVHKYFSGYPESQVNVFVSAKRAADFYRVMSRKYPQATVKELKPPTTFLAHSSKVKSAREDLVKFIRQNRILFQQPLTPVVSNNNSGILTSSDDIRQAVLGIIDEPMHSQETSRLVDTLGADLVVEVGLGGKSESLLSQNRVRTPATSFTGNDNVLLLSALTRVSQLENAVEELKRTGKSQELDSRYYDILRRFFVIAQSNQLARKMGFRVIERGIQEGMLQEHAIYSPAFYEFLEIFQNTYLYRFYVETSLTPELALDDLVVSMRLKRRILASKDQQKIDLDAVIMDKNGVKSNVYYLDYKYPESVTFNFSRLHIPDEELARKASELIETQPMAAEIYEKIRRDLRLPSLDYFTSASYDDNSDKAGIRMIVYQFVMFKLMQLYRPAVLGQNFYYVSGMDDVGLCTSLAVSGALSIENAIALFQKQGIMNFAINDAVIKIIDPKTGAVLKSKSQISELINNLSGITANLTTMKNNFNSWIVSFDAAEKSKDKLPVIFNQEPIIISSMEDIWRKDLNVLLDVLEELSILLFTDQNGKVYRFAEGRGISTANIYAYVNADERVIGFGKGGSESLTIFLMKPGSTEITVRKVLSERLITAIWDRSGSGVMLPPFKKALAQARFLQGLPEETQQYFPRVSNIEERDLPIPPGTPEAEKFGSAYHELIYDMNFIPGDEVSEFIRKYNPAPKVVARLYEEIFRVLEEKVHSQRRREPKRPSLESSYFKKIEDRLVLSRKTAPQVFNNNLLDSEYITINGVRYLNIKGLLRRFREHPEYLKILEPVFHSLVSGDTNTENIKITNIEPILRAVREGNANFTAEEIGIKFFDPRAIGYYEDGRDTGSDDPMYDNKPWHNSIGEYDVIHGEHFDLVVTKNSSGGVQLEMKIHSDNPYAASYAGIEQYFKEVMTKALDLDNPNSEFLKNDPYWVIRFAFIMGTHFAAMPPFHFKTEEDGRLIDDYTNQRRPVAIYAEGIKWLNLALDMLEGRKTEYLGFKVPQVPQAPPAKSVALVKLSVPINGPQQLSNESRTFLSPWMRIVRATAVGQYPVNFDNQTASNLRQALKALEGKIPASNKYQKFTGLLTNLILDINNPVNKVDAQELKRRTDELVAALKEIEDPSAYVLASSMLFDSFAKLGVNSELLVNADRDLVNDALSKLAQIEIDKGAKGAYERLLACVTVFLSIGQLGFKDRLTQENNYVSESLDLLSNIESAFYRGRSAASLFSALKVLGYEGYIWGGDKDYFKETLDYLDANLWKAAEAQVGHEDIFDSVYPVVTILNAMALCGKPEYLTYKRDWVEEGKIFIDKISPSDRMNQLQYFLIALRNLGKLNEYFPDLRSYLKNIIDAYIEHGKTHKEDSQLYVSMDDTYVVETCWMFGYQDLIPDSIINRLVSNMATYKIGESYFNMDYGLSYALTALAEVGQSNLLFEPNVDFGNEEPFNWVINHFTPAEVNSITLPYIFHSIVGCALRMRGLGNPETAIFKPDPVASRSTQVVSKAITGVERLGSFSRQSRAFFSPWIRLVRGFALGENPGEFDSQMASNLRQALAEINNKVSSDNNFNRFASSLAGLILDFNEHKGLSAEVMRPRIQSMVESIQQIQEPDLYVLASSVLIDSLAKLGIDSSFLVNDNFDLVDAALKKAQEIPQEKGEKGAYERLAAYSTLLLAVGNLGLKDRIVNGKENHIIAALNLIETIPNAFYRGRGASAIFLTASMLGYKDLVISSGKDYLKEILDYFDEHLDTRTDTTQMKKRPIFNTDPLCTVLNAIAFLNKPEYLNYRRNWIEEARWFMSQLPPHAAASQVQYYIFSLYNLGKLGEFIPNVDEYVKEAIDNYVKFGGNTDALDDNMNDAYMFEIAWQIGRTDLIPQAMADRMLTQFCKYPAGEKYRNFPFGGAYILSALGEAGKAGLLFSPHNSYGGQSPLIWAIRNFSEGGRDERSTLTYLHFSIIDSALRMRGNSGATEQGDFLGELAPNSANAGPANPVPGSTRGGIDFRSLPVFTGAVGNLSLKNSPASIASLKKMELFRERQEMQKLIDSGIVPSAERIKEFVQASCLQGRLNSNIDKVVLCISDIFRAEEANCSPSDPVLKDILAILESDLTDSELKDIFVGVKA